MRKGALQRDSLQCALFLIPATGRGLRRWLSFCERYLTSTISRLMDARSLAPHMAMVSLSSAPIFSM